MNKFPHVKSASRFRRFLVVHRGTCCCSTMACPKKTRFYAGQSGKRRMPLLHTPPPQRPSGVCVCARVRERLGTWCSGLLLQEVSDVSEMSHRKCSLMERDDLIERRL